ncbi:universal stress protein A-like protein [Olea europaea var. sylvestris]|uniref:universal stress protein A-like protein n=1 Tax=Olea europaea var. sylvestris TaxID=158386 RepID=UPI000C1D61D3|nr:universal stress protein A-like protein [Olea europaea var. sylvestris]
MDTTTAETSSTGAEGAAHQPLTTAATAEEKSKTKVLVAMDESDGSFYALKWALDHFFWYPIQPDQEPGMIILVHVQPIFQPFIYPAGPVVYATPSMLDSVKQAQAQNAASIFSRALQMCKEKKIKAETLILEGDPKDRICQAAEQLHADLLVIGSRGLGTIKRAFLGSASNYCAHHVQCPILIVKPPPPSKESHLE